MRLFYEVVNVENWDFFKKIKSVGDVDNFFYVNGMNIGDKVIIHVARSENNNINGVYAWGTIIGNPKIEKNKENYCYSKKAVDVRIEKFSHDKPLLNFEECKKYINNFRSTHEISEESAEKIISLLGIE